LSPLTALFPLALLPALSLLNKSSLLTLASFRGIPIIFSFTTLPTGFPLLSSILSGTTEPGGQHPLTSQPHPAGQHPPPLVRVHSYNPSSQPVLIAVHFLGGGGQQR